MNNWVIFTLFQSCHHATELLTRTEEAGHTASFVLGVAWGMWVWEPPAKPAPPRSCPSHEPTQKCSLSSTLPWRWTQSPHRPACSEGLLPGSRTCWGIAAGGLEGHTQSRTSFMSSWSNLSIPTTQHQDICLQLLGCLSAYSPGVLWRCLLAKRLQPNQTTKASNGWVLYTFSKEVCNPSVSLFFHGLTVGYLVFPCIS